jgi:O-antigen biosynthesis protein
VTNGLSGAEGELQDRYLRLIRTAGSADEAVRMVLAASPFEVYLGELRAAGAVTVSTEPLAAQYRRFNPHVSVLPNAIDLEQRCYQAPERRRPHDGIIIGHAGTQTHQQDLDIVAPALSVILARYDGQDGSPWARLMLGGDPRSFRGPCAGFPGASTFAGKIEAHYPNNPVSGSVETLESDCGRYLYRPFTRDVDSVPLMFADVDLGLIPLQLGTAVNGSKSDVKGLEMAGMGVPCIASPIDAYKRWRSEDNGCIVLSGNTERDWYEAMSALITDEDRRRRMADAALDFAKSRSIDVWVPKWMDVYTEAARRKGLEWAM